MRKLPADRANWKGWTAGCRLTDARGMDVDVVPGGVVLDVLDQGAVNVLRAPAERGGTGWCGDARIKKGHNYRSGYIRAAFVDMGSESWSGQARDSHLPAHLVVPWIQCDQSQTTSVPAQDG